MVERVLLGKHPDTGVIGFWVSRPGANARTSTDLANFLVHPDKINQRPFARITPIKFVKGTFVSTTTFSDGTKADNYTWTAHFFHNFGYIPVVIVVRNSGNIQEPWVDAAKIFISAGQMSAYRYNASDPSKTPIAGSVMTGPDWSYNQPDDTMNWVGTGPFKIPTSFIIYRNSIT